MRITIAAALTAGMMALGPGNAEAQGRFQPKPPTRGFLSVSGVFQATTSAFTERLEFEEFVEKGTLESSFGARPAPGLDGSLALRMWRNVGIGGGISTYAGPGGDSATVTARIPHPLFLNQHREVSGAAGLRRKETAIHGSLLYFVAVSPRVQALFGAGPTYFQVEQSFVNKVLYSHEYPYDTVTFRGVDLDRESASGVGFHASVDVMWRMSRSWGAGALVRYSHAKLAFTPAERQLKIDVGGLQAGLGLRAFF